MLAIFIVNKIFLYLLSIILYKDHSMKISNRSLTAMFIWLIWGIICYSQVISTSKLLADEKKMPSITSWPGYEKEWNENIISNHLRKKYEILIRKHFKKWINYYYPEEVKRFSLVKYKVKLVLENNEYFGHEDDGGTLSIPILSWTLKKLTQDFIQLEKDYTTRKYILYIPISIARKFVSEDMISLYVGLVVRGIRPMRVGLEELGKESLVKEMTSIALTKKMACNPYHYIKLLNAISSLYKYYNEDITPQGIVQSASISTSSISTSSISTSSILMGPSASSSSSLSKMQTVPKAVEKIIDGIVDHYSVEEKEAGLKLPASIKLRNSIEEKILYLIKKYKFLPLSTKVIVERSKNDQLLVFNYSSRGMDSYYLFLPKKYSSLLENEDQLMSLLISSLSWEKLKKSKKTMSFSVDEILALEKECIEKIMEEKYNPKYYHSLLENNNIDIQKKLKKKKDPSQYLFQGFFQEMSYYLEEAPADSFQKVGYAVRSNSLTTILHDLSVPKRELFATVHAWPTANETNQNAFHPAIRKHKTTVVTGDPKKMVSSGNNSYDLTEVADFVLANANRATLENEVFEWVKKVPASELTINNLKSFLEKTSNVDNKLVNLVVINHFLANKKDENYDELLDLIHQYLQDIKLQLDFFSKSPVQNACREFGKNYLKLLGQLVSKNKKQEQIKSYFSQLDFVKFTCVEKEELIKTLASSEVVTLPSILDWIYLSFHNEGSESYGKLVKVALSARQVNTLDELLLPLTSWPDLEDTKLTKNEIILGMTDNISTKAASIDNLQNFVQVTLADEKYAKVKDFSEIKVHLLANLFKRFRTYYTDSKDINKLHQLMINSIYANPDLSKDLAADTKTHLKMIVASLKEKTISPSLYLVGPLEFKLDTSVIGDNHKEFIKYYETIVSLFIKNKIAHQHIWKIIDKFISDYPEDSGIYQTYAKSKFLKEKFDDLKYIKSLFAVYPINTFAELASFVSEYDAGKKISQFSVLSKTIKYASRLIPNSEYTISNLQNYAQVLETINYSTEELLYPFWRAMSIIQNREEVIRLNQIISHLFRTHTSLANINWQSVAKDFRNYFKSNYLRVLNASISNNSISEMYQIKVTGLDNTFITSIFNNLTSSSVDTRSIQRWIESNIGENNQDLKRRYLKELGNRRASKNFKTIAENVNAIKSFQLMAKTTKHLLSKLPTSELTVENIQNFINLLDDTVKPYTVLVALVKLLERTQDARELVNIYQLLYQYTENGKHYLPSQELCSSLQSNYPRLLSAVFSTDPSSVLNPFFPNKAKIMSFDREEKSKITSCGEDIWIPQIFKTLKAAKVNKVIVSKWLILLAQKDLLVEYLSSLNNQFSSEEASEIIQFTYRRQMDDNFLREIFYALIWAIDPLDLNIQNVKNLMGALKLSTDLLNDKFKLGIYLRWLQFTNAREKETLASIYDYVYANRNVMIWSEKLYKILADNFMKMFLAKLESNPAILFSDFSPAQMSVYILEKQTTDNHISTEGKWNNRIYKELLKNFSTLHLSKVDISGWISASPSRKTFLPNFLKNFPYQTLADIDPSETQIVKKVLFRLPVSEFTWDKVNAFVQKTGETHDASVVAMIRLLDLTPEKSTVVLSSIHKYFSKITKNKDSIPSVTARKKLKSNFAKLMAGSLKEDNENIYLEFTPAHLLPVKERDMFPWVKEIYRVSKEVKVKRPILGWWVLKDDSRLKYFYRDFLKNYAYESLAALEEDFSDVKTFGPNSNYLMKKLIFSIPEQEFSWEKVMSFVKKVQSDNPAKILSMIRFLQITRQAHPVPNTNIEAQMSDVYKFFSTLAADRNELIRSKTGCKMLEDSFFYLVTNAYRSDVNNQKLYPFTPASFGCQYQDTEANYQDQVLSIISKNQKMLKEEIVSLAFNSARSINTATQNSASASTVISTSSAVSTSVSTSSLALSPRELTANEKKRALELFSNFLSVLLRQKDINSFSELNDLLIKSQRLNTQVTLPAISSLLINNFNADQFTSQQINPIFNSLHEEDQNALLFKILEGSTSAQDMNYVLNHINFHKLNNYYVESLKKHLEKLALGSIESDPRNIIKLLNFTFFFNGWYWSMGAFFPEKYFTRLQEGAQYWFKDSFIIDKFIKNEQIPMDYLFNWLNRFGDRHRKAKLLKKLVKYRPQASLADWGNIWASSKNLNFPFAFSNDENFSHGNILDISSSVTQMWGPIYNSLSSTQEKRLEAFTADKVFAWTNRLIELKVIKENELNKLFPLLARSVIVSTDKDQLVKLYKTIISFSDLLPLTVLGPEGEEEFMQAFLGKLLRAVVEKAPNELMNFSDTFINHYARKFGALAPRSILESIFSYNQTVAKNVLDYKIKSYEKIVGYLIENAARLPAGLGWAWLDKFVLNCPELRKNSQIISTAVVEIGASQGITNFDEITKAILSAKKLNDSFSLDADSHALILSKLSPAIFTYENLARYTQAEIVWKKQNSKSSLLGGFINEQDKNSEVKSKLEEYLEKSENTKLYQTFLELKKSNKQDPILIYDLENSRKMQQLMVEKMKEAKIWPENDYKNQHNILLSLAKRGPSEYTDKLLYDLYSKKDFKNPDYIMATMQSRAFWDLEGRKKLYYKYLRLMDKSLKDRKMLPLDPSAYAAEIITNILNVFFPEDSLQRSSILEKMANDLQADQELTEMIEDAKVRRNKKQEVLGLFVVNNMLNIYQSAQDRLALVKFLIKNENLPPKIETQVRQQIGLNRLRGQFLNLPPFAKAMTINGLINEYFKTNRKFRKALDAMIFENVDQEEKDESLLFYNAFIYALRKEAAFDEGPFISFLLGQLASAENSKKFTTGAKIKYILESLGGTGISIGQKIWQRRLVKKEYLPYLRSMTDSTPLPPRKHIFDRIQKLFNVNSVKEVLTMHEILGGASTALVVKVTLRTGETRALKITFKDLANRTEVEFAKMREAVNYLIKKGGNKYNKYTPIINEVYDGLKDQDDLRNEYKKIPLMQSLYEDKLFAEGNKSNVSKSEESKSDASKVEEKKSMKFKVIQSYHEDNTKYTSYSKEHVLMDLASGKTLTRTKISEQKKVFPVIFEKEMSILLADLDSREMKKEIYFEKDRHMGNYMVNFPTNNSATVYVYDYPLLSSITVGERKSLFKLIGMMNVRKKLHAKYGSIARMYIQKTEGIKDFDEEIAKILGQEMTNLVVDEKSISLIKDKVTEKLDEKSKLDDQDITDSDTTEKLFALFAAVDECNLTVGGDQTIRIKDSIIPYVIALGHAERYSQFSGVDSKGDSAFYSKMMSAVLDTLPDNVQAFIKKHDTADLKATTANAAVPVSAAAPSTSISSSSGVYETLE